MSKVNIGGTFFDIVSKKINISQNTFINKIGIWSGLTAYYRFDETSGTDLADSSGNNLSGTTTNTWTTGKNNNCGLFTGGTLATIPNYTQLNLSAVTVSAWVYLTSNAVSNGSMIVHKGTFPYNFRLGVNAGNYPEFSCGINGTFKQISSPSALTLNTWYNVVGQYDPSFGSKIYVNSVLGSSYSTGGTLSQSSVGLYIGRYYNNQDYNFTGLIDEVAIWNRGLSQSELQQIYNSGKGLFYEPNWRTVNSTKINIGGTWKSET